MQRRRDFDFTRMDWPLPWDRRQSGGLCRLSVTRRSAEWVKVRKTGGSWLDTGFFMPPLLIWNNRHKNKAESDRWNDEEIHRGNRAGVILEKGFPSLGAASVLGPIFAYH